MKKPQTKQNSGLEICLQILGLKNTEREHTVGLLTAAPAPTARKSNKARDSQSLLRE